MRDRRGGHEAAEHRIQPRIAEHDQHEPLHQLHGAYRQPCQELAPVDVLMARGQDVALALHPLDRAPAQPVHDPDRQAQHQCGDRAAQKPAQQQRRVARRVPGLARILDAAAGLRHQRIEALLGFGIDVAAQHREQQVVAQQELHTLILPEHQRHHIDRLVDRAFGNIAQTIARPLHAHGRRRARQGGAHRHDVAVEDAQRGRRMVGARAGRRIGAALVTQGRGHARKHRDESQQPECSGERQQIAQDVLRRGSRCRARILRANAHRRQPPHSLECAP